MKWRSCPADECIWVPLDGEFVVFHRPSGKTHFLNAASELLLNDILAEPQDIDSILETFGATVAEQDASAYSERMTDMLRRLEDLGLVQPA